MWNAAAFLTQAGYIAPSQLQAIDEHIGLPPRTNQEVEEWVAINVPGPDQAAQQAVVQQRAAERQAAKPAGGKR